MTVSRQLIPLVILLASAHATLAQTPDQDFATRCAAPGVIKCVGFNDNTEVVRDVNLFPIFGTNTFLGSVDTTTRASGAGSLRFDIPANAPGADMAGKFVTSLGDEFGARNVARFSGKNKFYVQFRQRFSDAFTRGHDLGALHFKQVAINNSDKCGDVTIVTENSQGRGFPQLYADCGQQNFIQVVGGIDILQQNASGAGSLYWCRYTDQRNGNYGGCSLYKANQWITFYYEIEVGDEDTPNGVVRAFIGFEGEPLRQFIDYHDASFDFNRGSEAPQAFKSISFLSYTTGKTSAESNEAAQTWYDELIISRQPINPPNGVLIRPRPPTGLTAQ